MALPCDTLPDGPNAFTASRAGSLQTLPCGRVTLFDDRDDAHDAARVSDDLAPSPSSRTPHARASVPHVLRIDPSAPHARRVGGPTLSLTDSRGDTRACALRGGVLVRDGQYTCFWADAAAPKGAASHWYYGGTNPQREVAFAVNLRCLAPAPRPDEAAAGRPRRLPQAAIGNGDHEAKIGNADQDLGTAIICDKEDWAMFVEMLNGAWEDFGGGAVGDEDMAICIMVGR
ncbi:hypothetical protein DFH27DRAFT_568192 [Peziza echinospora]|nr:hypothetical protein DFH27DRAFT_568192 [Peziza echinospora]